MHTNMSQDRNRNHLPEVIIGTVAGTIIGAFIYFYFFAEK